MINLRIRLKSAAEKIQSDIDNIKQVMSEEMSTSDWTVLFLVRNRLFTEKKNIEELIKDVRHADRIFASSAPRYYKEKAIVLRAIREAERRTRRLRLPIKENELQDPIIALPNALLVDQSPTVNSRPKRNRKVPDRLNIATTKGKTYQ